MGSQMEDNKDAPNSYYKRSFRRVVETWIGCLGSFSISIVGGLILTWWELWYHPTNSQLWMVPSGLILFITPVIIWSSIFVSYMFNNPNPSSKSNPNPSPGDENSSNLWNVQSGGDMP